MLLVVLTRRVSRIATHRFSALPSREAYRVWSGSSVMHRLVIILILPKHTSTISTLSISIRMPGASRDCLGSGWAPDVSYTITVMEQI